MVVNIIKEEIYGEVVIFLVFFYFICGVFVIFFFNLYNGFLILKVNDKE